MELTKWLGKTVLYGDVAISPDAAHVAWIQSTASSTAKQPYVRAGSGEVAPKLVTLPNDHDSESADPAWSPDSQTLAFFSTAGEKEQRQLWLVGNDGLNPRKVTQLKGYAALPRWSPNGKQIAFFYVDGASGGGPLLAARPKTGVIDTAIHNQRIAILDLNSKKVHQVSPPDLHVYDFDWSPDNKTFVVTAAPGPGNNNWWIAQIYKIDSATGQAQSIYTPSLQVAIPRWSPDGKSIAFIEGLMSDEGFHGGDLVTINATGEGLINHTKDRKTSVSSLFWQKPDRILLTEYTGGGSAISELLIGDNSVQTMWSGSESLHAFGNFGNFALSHNGRYAAVVRSNFSTPPEIWCGPIGAWRQLTRMNAGLNPRWGKAENLEWTNDNFSIQGWVIPPPELAPEKKYAMVVLVHGGPSGVTTSDWPADFGMSRAVIATLSSRGYFVLLPNPRGSYGRGETFTRANVKDFGGGDLKDIIAGVDAAIAKYPIDSARLGVMGWSYGGFMTMWAVTQTQRFRSAVAGAGIANWQSYYGQNLIDQWMIPFFGASVYDDPAVYSKSSPIQFIKNVRTPTLVMVGEHDAECPAPQSYEFWHALRTLKVPTQLIVYPGEGHMFVRPENQADRLDQMVTWFDKFLR